jgi:dephospho-CoA kinase
MFKIGLTGGIGSGKSWIASQLAQAGAAVIDVDDVAHDLTAPGGAAMAPIVAAFGPAAQGFDGALDRAWMRELTFSDVAMRRRLESIMHPMIRQRTEELASQAQGVYLVLVVPLLVESGNWRERVDRVCVVDCDPETQVARVQARSGLTGDIIRRIMAAQAPRNVRLAAADDVVLNDGSVTLQQLSANISRLHAAWCELAGSR